MSMAQRDFDGFYGLRYLSILVILVAHLFMTDCDFGTCHSGYGYLQALGNCALQFFFVASAFLITFLLLAEEQKLGRLSIRNFFLRRVLRIWPAYFVLLLLVWGFVNRAAFFHIPYVTDAFLAADTTRCYGLYFAFLPHIVPFYHAMVPYLHHTYTIGIEEQFYFLWGILFLLVRKRRQWLFAAAAIGIPLLGSLHAWAYAGNPGLQRSATAGAYAWKAVTYLQYSRLSTFAIGSFLGYAYFHNRRWILYFQRPLVRLLVYVLLLLVVLTRIEVPFVHLEVLALLVGALMLVASFPGKSNWGFHNRVLVHLGHRSYGIYLFHIIALVLALRTVEILTLQGTPRFAVLLLLAIAYATGLGWLSYRFVETPFLKLKDRFKRVDPRQAIAASAGTGSPRQTPPGQTQEPAPAS
ncbi:MAG: acyltransferase [Sphingobacteriales bacterium]|nr:MAG: acyltransferase [Sphingobacteriales bacterium]